MKVTRYCDGQHQCIQHIVCPLHEVDLVIREKGKQAKYSGHLVDRSIQQNELQATLER